MNLLEAGHAAAMEAIKDMPPLSAEAGATPTETAPEDQQVQEAATDETDSFTKLDPNALPPEMQPYYKAMQADYTRKMQEASPYRKLGEDSGLDADSLRQAAELYSTLQNPDRLVEFYNELSTALQQQGLTPAQADVAATQHIQEQIGLPQENEDWSTDPEERRFQALEQKLAQFEQAQAEAQQRAQHEQMNMALVAEMNRQEGLVREANPDWAQADVDAVYELSAFYGGSLIDAGNRYNEIISDRLTRILNSKGSVASDPAHAPLPPAVPGLSTPHKFADLDEAHRAAMDAAKRLP